MTVGAAVKMIAIHTLPVNAEITADIPERKIIKTMIVPAKVKTNNIVKYYTEKIIFLLEN